MGRHFDPWKYAAQHFPGVHIDTYADLPIGILGVTNGTTIWLSRRLTQVARRCTLMHELRHIERGPAPDIAWMADKEHRVIDTDSARTLISFDRYLDALRWSHHEIEIADDLWVDVPTLRDFVASLTAAERAQAAAVVELRAA